MASPEITYPPLYITPGGLESLEAARISTVTPDQAQFETFNTALGPLAPSSWDAYPIVITGPKKLCPHNNWQAEVIDSESLTRLSGTPSAKSLANRRVTRTTIDSITRGDPDLTAQLTDRATYAYFREYLTDIPRLLKSVGGTALVEGTAIGLFAKGYHASGIALGAVSVPLLVGKVRKSVGQVTPRLQAAKRITGLLGFELLPE